MKRPLAVGLLLVSVALAAADDGIPAKTLAEIKAATVFIKMETVRTAGSGSGFVIQADKDSVLVVTNYHVISTGNVNDGPVRKLEVTFRSGKAKEEATYSAEVLAADWERDLAILRVKKVADPPKPIDLTAKAEASETATVYAVGFPFGEALATTDGNPAPTISKASVSSLREDDQGELAVVQLEGGINPGNSGGPVVDAKGRLVGVAVAKLRNTNIGFAIPPHELTKMLQGRYRMTETTVVKSDGKEVELEFTLNFIDPFQKVKAASLRVVKSDDPLPKPGKGAAIPELTGGTTYEVKVSGERGKVRVKVPVAAHHFQVTFANEGRKDNRTLAARLDVQAVTRGLTQGRPDVPDPKVPDPKVPTPNLPKPVNPLPGGVTAVGDLKVKSAQVSTEAERGRPGSRSGAADSCVCWTADAKGFYALDHGAETVRRFSFPDLKEEAKLVVGKDVSWLSLSKEGLVLTVNGDQEAWVLDPKTLKKGTTFPVNKAIRVLSAPSHSVAYVFDTGDGPFGGGTLRVIDLKTGKKLKEYEAKDLGKNVALFTPVISADGKHLYTTDVSTTRLMQFTLDGETVKYVTACDGLLSGAFNQPVVSADGKLVAAPSGGGNGAIKGRKPAPYSTFVFDTKNLQDPILELKTGAYPRAIGFDTKAGLIFAQSFQDQLIILDRDGSKLKSHRLGEGGEPYQFLPHPDGWMVLVFVPGGTFGRAATVYSVEIPKKK